jgi:nucleotide-binding universal stress UspA family protein
MEPMLTVCSKIVVPFDNSELNKKALKTAMALANENEQISLDVILVVPIIMPTTYYAAINVEAQRDAQFEAAGKIVDEVEQELKQLPNNTKTAVLEGNPPEAIIEYAEQNEADLIVMGSRGLGGLKELFLGSVSHYVIQKAKCSVYIVK